MLYTLNSYEQHPPYTASAFLIQHFVERTTKSTISCGATMAGDIKFARTTLTNFVKPSISIYSLFHNGENYLSKLWSA